MVGKIFSGSLKKSGFSSPFYVVHGEEELLRLEAADQIRNHARQLAYQRERFVVEGHFDWNEIIAAVQSMGMFSDGKLIEIHVPSGKLGKQGADTIPILLDNPPPDTVILWVFPKLERAQMQAKWFQLLAQKAVIYEAKSVDLNALPQWIRERLQDYDLTIESDALTLFAQRVEGNLLAAKQEIDKLALLHPAGYCVNMADTEAAVANVARFDVFQLSSAWLGGDAKRVAHLLDGLDADDAVLLLWSVAEDIRTLIRLTAALKQGQTVQSVRQELRLWGEKQTLMPRAVQRISPSRLVGALQECAKIDRQIKGAESGDAWASLRHLLLKLSS